jgi:hypothetical protein|tara:strand:- start:65 stop:283 length:219 start_codon:yes stop_codon:yes gene_type:complete
MSRKTAADVHLELAVHEKECAERWKTAFNKFDEIDRDVKEINTKLDNGTKTIIGLLIVLISSIITLIVRNLF